MFNLTLKPHDTIETVLPVVEKAMEAGEICRIDNINYLGFLGGHALTLLMASDGLLDSETGRVFHPHPGFGLLGVDDQGFSSVLA
jgi:hypothetical protein